MRSMQRKPYNGKESSRRRLKDQFQGLMLQLEGCEVALGRNCKEVFFMEFPIFSPACFFLGQRGQGEAFKGGS